MAEVGNGLEIGRQSTGQPHQLDVALRLSLPPPTRRDAIQITVDVELEQHPRVVRRAPADRWISALETERLQVQLLDEGIDRPYRVVFADAVVQYSGSSIAWLRSSPSMNRFIRHPFIRRLPNSTTSRRFHTPSADLGRLDAFAVSKSCTAAARSKRVRLGSIFPAASKNNSRNFRTTQPVCVDGRSLPACSTRIEANLGPSK